MDLTCFKGLPDWAKGQDPRSHCYSSYTVENYDYQGHLSQQRLAVFTDLDAVVDDWLSATLSR